MKPSHILRRVLLVTCLAFSPISGVLAAPTVWEPLQFDMAPNIQKTVGAAANRRPLCQVEPDKIILANANLRCTFSRAGDKLRLVSLYNELVAAEMVRNPDDCRLLAIETGGKHYFGSRDFTCRRVEALPGQQGFAATLLCEAIGLEAVLTVRVDDDLCMGLTIANRGSAPIDFKAAFPYLAGLAISDQPVDDYYFFPLKGGIISDVPAIIRGGYGDYGAIYQVMDLFSPARGAGLAVRCTDEDGRYKILALRKCVVGRKETGCDFVGPPTTDEFKFANCLDAVPGTSMTYQYLRRTRKPGESFAVKDVALRAHAGDWHTAMKMYADWCRRVWKFRPYPSRLTPVNNMLGAGWGGGLFLDGKYQNLVRPQSDCVELMSWWEWSPLGPWQLPFERLAEKIDPKELKTYRDSFSIDPVTGKKMYPYNRGDYDGYNVRWGGLPAFREAIKSYRQQGALVTLYTDPLLADDNTKCGQKWGKLWAGVNPDGTPRIAYQSWYMCHDVAAYRQFVADTMGRVIRETDADGIRLDEYGHAGFACFSKEHRHTFAEWGCTEWQRCIAETAKMVHRAMDDAKPGTVLTTEHPGYDFLMSRIEGCITYDFTNFAITPMRPMLCNLQRFYFPECKPYELDMFAADPKHRKRFWNAEGTFGAPYPTDMYTILRENEDAFSSRDCEPLIATLARYVYVNRFHTDGKTIYTIYNTKGQMLDGPVLRIPLKPGQHAVDLLRCRNVRCEPGKEGTVVHTDLAHDDVTCLAVLPVRLGVKCAGDSLETTVESPGSGWQLRICDVDGQPLVQRPAASGVNLLDLRDIKAKGAKPSGVKLMDGKRLVDFVPLPFGKGAKAP